MSHCFEFMSLFLKQCKMESEEIYIFTFSGANLILIICSITDRLSGELKTI